MILAWALSFGLLLLGLVLQHYGWRLFPVDSPAAQQHQGRKKHQHDTPMLGWALGLGCLFLFHNQVWLLAAALVVLGVGISDDRLKCQNSGVPWWLKALAILLAACLGLMHLQTLYPDLGTSQQVSIFCLLFVIMNAVNFMDNTNGVATSLGCLGLWVASGGNGNMALVALIFLGFLPLNWPWPFAFLGDSGALLLGLSLGLASLDSGLQQAQLWSFAGILPMGLFLLDFVQVVTARLWIGVAPWIGDRRHLTHISINLGVPRLLVAPLFCLLSYALLRSFDLIAWPF